MKQDAVARQELILRRLHRWGAVRSVDLSRAAEVTIKTVQRDLAELESRGDLVRVHGGAVAPRHPRSREMPRLRIGVLFPTRNLYYESVRAGVESIAPELNVDVIEGAYGYSGDLEVHQINRLAELRLDGLILTLGYENDGYKDLAGLGIPAVLVERPLHALGGRRFPSHVPTLAMLDHVYSDHGAGLLGCLDHLFALGHRSVHCLIETTPTAPSLRIGVSEAQRDDRLPYWGSVSMQTFEIHHDGWRSEELAGIVRECVEGRRTALLAHTDTLAIALHRELQAAGVSIPGDVSLLSYNDVDPGCAELSISAAAPQRSWVGTLATELLVDRLRSRGRRTHDRRPPHRTSLLPELVLRGSTATPPAATVAP